VNIPWRKQMKAFKLSILILLSLLAVSCKDNDSKTLKQFDFEQFIWEKHEKSVTNDFKKSEMKKINGHNIEYFLGFFNERVLKSNDPDTNVWLKGIHFIDINGDKHLDIVVDNVIMTIHYIIICLNNNGRYDSILSEQGTVTNIYKSKNKNVLNLQITLNGCCGDFRNIDSIYKFSNGKFNLLEKRLYFADTQFPEKLNNSELVTFGTDFNLRYKAEVARYPEEDFPRDNIVGRFKKGSQGYILNSVMDSQKNIWDFVLVNKNTFLLNSLLDDPEDNKLKDIIVSYYGWKKKNDKIDEIYLNNSAVHNDKVDKNPSGACVDESSSNNRAVPFESDNRWGYKFKTGEAVIPPEFDSANKFSEGIAAVKKKDKWGFINTKGQLVVQYKYDDVKIFSEGLAPVLIDGLWGYINCEGNVAIPNKYSFVTLFARGEAIVKLDGKKFVINKKGEIRK
jgi:hypothetical protein